VTGVAADSYDYVVVGGGTAGCIGAARLTEDPEVSVLLVEAGGDERRADIESPEAWWSLPGSDVDWNFETVLQPTLGRSYPAARGKVLGGSGSINNMIHLRGHAADFDGWAAAGAHGWDYASVLPYFKRSEDVPDGDPRYRGRGGPLRPRPYAPDDPVGLRFVEGAARAGHAQVEDFNAAEMLGTGFIDALIYDNRRESTATAYLRPAMGRDNLTVHQDALVRRLAFEGKRCAGVEYVRNGIRTRAIAGEVILCAGAIGSPHLLMLSGVGPADDLTRFGIVPIVDAPEVGRNLQDHILLAGIRYQAQRPLPPSAMTSAMLMTRSDGGEHGPDLQILVANEDYHLEWQDPAPNSFTFGVSHMRARSRGTVRLRSADPAAQPVIDPCYLSEPYDLDQLIAGIEMVEHVVATNAFDEWGGGSQTTALLQLGRAALEDAVRESIGSYFHLAGTCRMGSDAAAVVDPALRVMGVEGLRVADASVMPTLVTSNSNAATVMIGEKAADLVRGRPGGRVNLAEV
jgi:choline dehydrogenase